MTYIFRISDSASPLMTPYVFIEAKDAKDAIKKHLKSCGIVNANVKRMERGFNRYFSVMKVEVVEHRDGITYHNKAGNKVYYEMF